jgi:hypothetical protein
MKKSGVTNPTVYSRYNLATNTWEEINITLPGYDNTRYWDGNADAYAIDARGSNVAVIMGDVTSDIAFWKSSDNGQTWTKTIIDSFPIAAYHNQELILDTPRVADGSLSVKIDASGMAHCFWGRLRYLNTTGGGTGGSVFLGTNAIDYWYEGRPDSGIAVVGFGPDMDGDGQLAIGDINERTRYGNAGASTMPCAGIDSSGRLFVIYSALTDNDLDGNNGGFRDVFCVYSEDNGVTWSDPRNLTQHLGVSQEQMFASMAPTIEDKLDITYMTSYFQGFYSATDNSNKTGPFDIIYLPVYISDIINNTVGVADGARVTAKFTVNQNFPNPFNGSTIIPVSFKSSSDATVSVQNIMGQSVYTETFKNVGIGYSELEINPASLRAGVYFYTVEAQGYKVTNKMIVR